MQLISPSATETEVKSERPPASPARSRIRRASIILLFLLPSVILYTVLVVVPIIQAAYYSLFRWDGLEPLVNFVGLHNYLLAFSNPVFLETFAHNLLIVALSLCIELPFALLVSLVIGKKLPGGMIFRAIFFMPFVISEVIAGVIWQFIYRPDGGLLDAILQALNPHFQGGLWLADPRITLICIFVVIVWKYFGLYVVLYTAAIQNVPDEIVEAARVDGATGLQVTRYITIPLLGTTIRLSILLSVLGSLQIFDIIYVMTHGGPIHASEVFATYLITYGINAFAMGYGSAIGVVMFLTCFVFALMYQRFAMQRDVASSIAMQEA
ncbi:MAG TPA: sugar ABC transporter permease [Ktedonobacteraceae bacterium]|nr:sugar ABC transporter permease [Ktedonobacteraceae bacterium]